MSRAFLKGELDKEFRNLERHRSNPSKNKKSDIEPQTTSCHGVKKASKRSKPKQSGYKSTAPLDLKKILSSKYILFIIAIRAGILSGFYQCLNLNLF